MNKFARKYGPALVSLLVAVVFLVCSIASRSYTRNPSRVAHNVSHRLEKRLSLLEDYALEALGQDSVDFLSLEGLPKDMVVYRYEGETLKGWANRFNVLSDDLHTPFFASSRLSRSEYSLASPFSDLKEEWRLLNVGPKWYVARTFSDRVVTTVVAALELCSVSEEGTMTDVNPKLRVPSFYSLNPLVGFLGEPICRGDSALLLLSCPSPDVSSVFADSPLRWIGLGFLLLSFLLLLSCVRSKGAFAAALLSIWCCSTVAWYWGSQMSETVRLFSPSLYAGGSVWSSFGALLVINLALVLTVVAVYLMRRKIEAWASRSLGRMHFFVGAISISVVALIGYSIFSIDNIVANSNISFAIMWFRDDLLYTLLALASYTLLSGSMMLLVQMLMGAVQYFTGEKIRLMAPRPLLIVSVLLAIFLSAFPERLSLQKEQQRAEVWANRLAVDRDLGLELRLRGIDEAIARDEMLSMLSRVDGAWTLIAKRIEESYLARFSNEYDIVVSTCSSGDGECTKLFARKLSGAVPLSEGSRWGCIYQPNGKATYAALYSYPTPQGEDSRMLIEVVSRTTREDNGYYSIFTPLDNPSSVLLPEEYSYGKYVDSKLVSFKGLCPYPTILSGKYANLSQNPKGYFRSESYLNFINPIDEGEVIFISRPRKKFLQMFASFLTMLAVITLVLIPFGVSRHRRRPAIRSTFKRKITIILTLAIFLALIFSAGISVRFVFERNRTAASNAMTSKISTIQNMVEDLSKDALDYRDLISSDFHNAIAEVAAATKSDISLYTTDGRAFSSTVSEVFDRLLLSTRIDREAYYEIVYNHRRVYIARESFKDKPYFNLYAPIFNKDDKMVAIVSSPFNPGPNLAREAFPHAMMMLIIVITLLIFFGAVSSSVVGAVFAPLTEVSRNMAHAGEKGLSRISYPHNDEITPLIESYNRMVGDLEESTRRMAENERDLAWSEMARQVAHEIKNPLTPMKLSIQRLIRQKQKNAPDWDVKFEELSKVILDQIDILTETANDFSTFAKLYTEDPVDIDLDALLREQLTIFDSKDNIEFTYLGMPEAAVVSAPRPQLARVIVNLLTNAVQAIEISQSENAGEPNPGKVNVYLRSGAKEGFFDIAVEDNGPGVPADIRDRVFTPKFTTKSSGTGLGLAISRNIVQKCGGDITLGRSLSLGGASFTVRLPKKK